MKVRIVKLLNVLMGISFQKLLLEYSFEGDISIKQVGDSNGTADRLKKLELPTGDSFLVIVGNPDLSVNLCSVSDLYKRKQCHCAMVLKKGERSKEDNNKVQKKRIIMMIRLIIFMV